MKLLRFLFLISVCQCVLHNVTAQNFTVSGYVRDKQSGEELIGANIYLNELKQGTSTNPYGFYSLTIPEGNYTDS